MSKKKALLSWSTGKDSYWALHLLRQRPDLEVTALVTTFNTAFDRVAMHAVRRSLAEAQAARLSLPLWPVELPWPCSNPVYEECMGRLCERAVAGGITAVAFGDLFLQDIRDYREKQSRGTGLVPIFPLWQIPTGQLAHEIIEEGLKARITCVDPSKMDRSAAGRDYDREFLASLPDSVDPCGENGEFHTFVYDGPLFSRPIDISPGEIVDRDGFIFADLQPSDQQ
jgi:uncharacterized protein (TIGR00290 family)